MNGGYSGGLGSQGSSYKKNQTLTQSSNQNLGRKKSKGQVVTQGSNFKLSQASINHSN
jgi:hypothetical protein